MPRFLSFDIGLRNFAYCVLDVSPGCEVSCIHEWRVLEMASPELNETETVRCVLHRLDLRMADPDRYDVDHVLVERQHYANKRTDCVAHALLAVFRSRLAPHKKVYMPYAGLKVKWSLAWAAEQGGDVAANVPKRTAYKGNHSYNKAVARYVTQAYLEEHRVRLAKELALFASSPKKDDLADCLLQALAFVAYELPKRVCPAAAAEAKNQKLLQETKDRKIQLKQLRKRARKGEPDAVQALDRKKQKRARRTQRKQRDAEEALKGSLPLMR